MKTFEEQLSQFVNDVRVRIPGGLTLAELGEIFVSFAVLAVSAARELTNPGADKKQIVMAQIAQLFDLVAPAIPLPILLRPFASFLLPTIRRIVLALADGAVESIYRRLSQ